MIRAITLAALLLAFATAASSANITCSLSGSGITFGVFSGSQLTTRGQITIHCTGNGNDSYELKLSTGSSATYSSRQMKNGANGLSYNLYVDPAFMQIWGDGTGGSTFASGNLMLGSAHTVTVDVPIYGKLPAQMEPTAGNYSDTIVATLSCPTGADCPAAVSFTVTASAPAGCTISATSLFFGTYTAATQLNGRSLIFLRCSNASPWNIGLNQGTYSSATVTTRRMTGPGTASLLYFLYQDAARTLNWGNTVGVDTVSGAGTGAVQALTVFGQVPAAQTGTPGGYLDTIVATLTF